MRRQRLRRVQPHTCETRGHETAGDDRAGLSGNFNGQALESDQNGHYCQQNARREELESQNGPSKLVFFEHKNQG